MIEIIRCFSTKLYVSCRVILYVWNNNKNKPSPTTCCITCHEFNSIDFMHTYRRRRGVYATRVLLYYGNLRHRSKFKKSVLYWDFRWNFFSNLRKLSIDICLQLFSAVNLMYWCCAQINIFSGFMSVWMMWQVSWRYFSPCSTCKQAIVLKCFRALCSLAYGGT